MTIKLALIEAGFISTVSLHSDGNPFPPGNWMPLDEAIAAGHQYKQSAEPTPDCIPLWAFRSAISMLGLMDAVAETIEALPDPPKTVAWQQWEYGNNPTKASELVQTLKDGLGLTDAKVDEIFRLGASLQ
jgi:hypothetical protein